MAVNKNPTAVYIRAAHLGTWKFEEQVSEHMALSGTDRAMMWLVSVLRAEFENLLVITDNPPVNNDLLHAVVVGNLSESVAICKACNAEFLIFSNIEEEKVLAALSTAMTLGQKLILWDHNGPSPKVADVANSAAELVRIVCVSQAQADEARHRRIFDRVSVIYNGVDLNFWQSGSSANRRRRDLVYVGALTPSKGFHHLAQVWSDVRAAFPDTVLHVCGASTLYNRGAILGPLGLADSEYEIKHIIPNIGKTRVEAKQNGVVFHGLTSPAEIRDILSSAWLGVVNPNTRRSGETFCVAAVEIQAAGVPVLGGRYGGLLETVSDGKSGSLVNGTTELRREISRFIRMSDGAWESFSRSAQTHAAKFSVENSRHCWLQLLRDPEHPRHPEFRLRPFTSRRYAKQLLRLLHLRR